VKGFVDDRDRALIPNPASDPGKARPGKARRLTLAKPVAIKLATLFELET